MILVKGLQKYQRSNLEVKKIYRFGPGRGHISLESGQVSNFFFDLQPWPLIFLQPHELQEHKVPHLKDLLHICLEPEARGHGVTFKVCNASSN